MVTCSMCRHWDWQNQVGTRCCKSCRFHAHHLLHSTMMCIKATLYTTAVIKASSNIMLWSSHATIVLATSPTTIEVSSATVPLLTQKNCSLMQTQVCCSDIDAVMFIFPVPSFFYFGTTNSFVSQPINGRPVQIALSWTILGYRQLDYQCYCHYQWWRRVFDFCY